jgi:hypothetical protein
MSQIEDLITAYTLGSVTGLDTGTGKRDVDLKDPLVYTDTVVEEESLPDDLKYVTRGEGLRKKEYVGNKGRDELNFLQKIGLGIVDAMTDNKFDWDRADLIPKDEYNEKRLLEKKLKGDLSGDALPSPEQTRKNLVSQAIRDDYAIDRLKELNDYELERFKDAYPQYAKMINDEIFNRRMQIEYNSPSEIQNRINASRRGYVDAIAERARAQNLIADATYKGIDRKFG